MTGWSSPRAWVWGRSRFPVPVHGFAWGLALVLAVAAEFRRAAAAADRYEKLASAARACDDPETGPARRVYVEFYAGR